MSSGYFPSCLSPPLVWKPQKVCPSCLRPPSIVFFSFLNIHGLILHFHFNNKHATSLCIIKKQLHIIWSLSNTKCLQPAYWTNQSRAEAGLTQRCSQSLVLRFSLFFYTAKSLCFYRYIYIYLCVCTEIKQGSGFCCIKKGKPMRRQFDQS